MSDPALADPGAVPVRVPGKRRHHRPIFSPPKGLRIVQNLVVVPEQAQRVGGPWQKGLVHGDDGALPLRARRPELSPEPRQLLLATAAVEADEAPVGAREPLGAEPAPGLVVRVFVRRKISARSRFGWPGSLAHQRDVEAVERYQAQDALALRGLSRKSGSSSLARGRRGRRGDSRCRSSFPPPSPSLCLPLLGSPKSPSSECSSALVPGQEARQWFPKTCACSVSLSRQRGQDLREHLARLPVASLMSTRSPRCSRTSTSSSAGLAERAESRAVEQGVPVPARDAREGGGVVAVGGLHVGEDAEPAEEGGRWRGCFQVFLHGEEREREEGEEVEIFASFRSTKPKKLFFFLLSPPSLFVALAAILASERDDERDRICQGRGRIRVPEEGVESARFRSRIRPAQESRGVSFDGNSATLPQTLIADTFFLLVQFRAGFKRCFPLPSSPIDLRGQAHCSLSVSNPYRCRRAARAPAVVGEATAASKSSTSVVARIEEQQKQQQKRLEQGSSSCSTSARWLRR